MVRQLSIDQFENEARRIGTPGVDMLTPGDTPAKVHVVRSSPMLTRRRAHCSSILTVQATPPYLLGLSFPKWSSKRHSYVLENKTRRAEASFDLYGDDNGPGSEPPPQDHTRYALAVTPGRWRSPAAVGKPSFACFYG